MGLGGRRILVTRPLDQAQSLAALIRAAGGEPIVFPAIDIGPPQDRHTLDAVLARLAEFDLAVFVSPTAVDWAFRALAAAAIGWPRGLRAATVGPASAGALAAHGVPAVAEVIVPATRFDSEGLLAHPALAAVAGWQVVIFRGGSGRELLGDTLRARGARVEYAPCYERRPPAADPGPLIERWQRDGIDAAVLTSSEGVANLAQAIGPVGPALFARTVVFVPHPRIGAAARAAGAVRIVVTGAGDSALVAAMDEHLR